MLFFRLIPRRNVKPVAKEFLKRFDGLSGILAAPVLRLTEVARRAMKLAASSSILVHNHPSGDPTPSKPEIEMAKQVVAATNAIGVTVHNHLVIGSTSPQASRRWA